MCNVDKQIIVSIMGPTGVGKTALVLELFSKIPIQIISVDSVQIYKDMNIGSGKPSTEILSDFPHDLINIIEPTDTYSTAKFQNDCLGAVKKAFYSDKLQFLVGGTMMYFDHLINGISQLPPTNEQVRSDINEEFERIGAKEMYNYLRKVDLKASLKIHENDSQRIKRALEVYKSTGKEFSKWQEDQRKEVNKLVLDSHLIQIAIQPKDKELHREIIAKRFKKMIETGLIDEVEKLLNSHNIDKNSQSMKSVGYRQVCEFLEGDISFDLMIEKAINATRQLSKRQMTWINSWKNLNIIENNSKLGSEVEKLLLKQL